MARKPVNGIDCVLANLPCTTAVLRAVMICHVEYDDYYLDRLLRDMRDARLIACANGVWYRREKL